MLSTFFVEELPLCLDIESVIREVEVRIVFMLNDVRNLDALILELDLTHTKVRFKCTLETRLKAHC